MIKPTFATFARLAPVLALFSCAAPKDPVIEPAAAPETKAAPKKVAASQPALPPPDDGLRLPDMVTMPDEGEFRATNPDLPGKLPNSGPAISRPPTDPPSRPKPQDSE